jgi:calcineurin-like phosphoesterase family protein
MTKWFTADLHLGHKNIIDHCDRPFTRLDGQPDVDLMDLRLGENWDKVVKPGDLVYILGDISFDTDRAIQWLKARPGQKFVVWGNHDPNRERDRMHLVKEAGILKAADIMETKLSDGVTAVMCHYPMLRWNKAHFGSWMLHGHTHGRVEYPYPMRAMDVGVDKWNYSPVSETVLRGNMTAVTALRHHYYGRNVK